MAPRKGKTIEDRAKDAGATGARLSAAKQTLRDSLIVRRNARGWDEGAGRLARSTATGSTTSGSEGDLVAA